jgi:hypothetical protein
MNRHPSGEHFHKLRDPLGARFRPFGIVHPVDDRVGAAKLAAVLAGESPANRGVQTLL